MPPTTQKTYISPIQTMRLCQGYQKWGNSSLSIITDFSKVHSGFLSAQFPQKLSYRFLAFLKSKFYQRRNFFCSFTCLVEINTFCKFWKSASLENLIIIIFIYPKHINIKHRHKPCSSQWYSANGNNSNSLQSSTEKSVIKAHWP